MSELENSEQFWEEELNNLNRSIIPVFIICTIFGDLIYSVYDYFSINHLWRQYLILRFLVAVVGLFILLLFNRRKITHTVAVYLLLAICYLFLAYGASQITDHIQLMVWNISTAMAGFLWPAVIVIDKYRVAIILNIFFSVCYLAFYFLNSTVLFSDLAVYGGVFLIFAVSVGPILFKMKYNLYKNNFKLKNDIELKNFQIEKQKNQLENQVNHDALTGVYSRRAGLEFLEDRIRLSIRNNKKLTITFIDVDNLKTVNDTLGHRVGDSLIVKIVNTIVDSIRESDIVCRVGGDEFLIIFYECEYTNTQKIINNINAKLESYNEESDKLFSVEMSYGIVEYDSKEKISIDEFIEKADKKMYQNKMSKNKMSKKTFQMDKNNL